MLSVSFWEKYLSPGRIASRAERLALERPVIIMGRGKSGTRLVAWACHHLGLAMGTHPNLATGDIDHRVFRKTVKRLAREPFFLQENDEFPDSALNTFQWVMEQVLSKLGKDPFLDNGWGWKWPETYLIAPIVLKTFPQARFIHLIRDGRDVAFNRHLTDDQHRTLGRRILRRLEALDKPHHIQAALSWKFQVESYRRFARHIPESNRFEMTYESLCRDPVGLLGRVAEFVERPLTDACRDYVISNVTVDHLDNFKKQNQAQVLELEELIGDTLVELGYDLVKSMPTRPD